MSPIFRIRCNICMKRYCNIESNIMLECNHTMCIKCLKKIYTTTCKCPFCRRDMKLSLVTLNYILKYGIYHRNKYCINFAISNNADINWINKKGDTILHQAIELDYKDGIKILLENGANPNILNNNGNKPIKYKKTNQINNILNRFININYKENIINEPEETRLMLLEFKNNNYNKVKYYIKKGADIYNDNFIRDIINITDESFIEFILLIGLNPYYEIGNESILKKSLNIGNSTYQKVIDNIKI